MGSIKQLKDNKYELTVSSGFGLNGKRQRYYRTVEADSPNKAKKALALFQSEIDKGDIMQKAEKLTFENFSKEWIKNYAEVNLAPKTLHRYKELLRLRIVPAFRNLALDRIKPTHLLQFYQNLKEEGIRLDNKKGGLSDRTIKHHHRLIHTMLQTAVRWQLLKENVAIRVTPPKVIQKDMNFYDASQVEQLIKALNLAPDKYKVIVLLALYTGMRRSEIMGLKWSEVDCVGNIVGIKQASQYIPRRGISQKETKNRSSKRNISIPTFISEILKTYRVIQIEQSLKCPNWINHDMLFTQDNGLPMHPDTITKWFREFIKANNLPYISLHGLRHTHATLLIQNSVDVVSVARRLGHSKSSTTLDIYAHAIIDSDKAVSDSFEKSIKVSVNCR